MNDIAVVDAVGNDEIVVVEVPYAADASEVYILVVGRTADVGYRAAVLAVNDADELWSTLGCVHNSNDAACSTAAII